MNIGQSVKIKGTLTAESLRILAGDKPLPTTEFEFRLSPSAAGWNADHLELRSGPAELQGSGTLLPLSLDLRRVATDRDGLLVSTV